MLLFEKRFIGVYCNGNMTQGKGMAPFRAMAELRKNSTGKDLNVTNTNTKVGPPNRQIGLPLNSSFL